MCKDGFGEGCCNKANVNKSPSQNLVCNLKFLVSIKSNALACTSFFFFLINTQKFSGLCKVTGYSQTELRLSLASLNLRV